MNNDGGKEVRLGTRGPWGFVLLVCGLVGVIAAPPSAVVLLSVACIAIFAGGYLSVVSYQESYKNKDNNDGKEK